jgi:uncharacterized protein YcbK (DUF882 family)
MKKMIRYVLALLLVLLLIFFCYCNNLSLANKKTAAFYSGLRKKLSEKGYRPRLLVISTRRFTWHNQLQVLFSGAAAKSRHLHGDAIDFLVLDINGDGKANGRDVDIVTGLLEHTIMKGGGGIGTYKNEKGFINRQLVHIDCREGRGRWAR